MLNEVQKKRLENHIYNLLKESLWERYIGEDSKDDNSKMSYRGHEDDFDYGKKKKKKKTDSEKEFDEKKEKKHNKDKHNGKKRKEVMDWLAASEDDSISSFSLNHADIMRKLWNPQSKEEEDELRSLFSKKLNHTLNDNGSEYDFSDDEINTLYNIKGGI